MNRAVAAELRDADQAHPRGLQGPRGHGQRSQLNEGWMMTGIFVSETIRCLVKGLAYKGWMYYVGGMIDLLGSYAMSIARAMLSCCVPANELGKVYSLMTFIEAIAPLGVVQVYASVWKVCKEVSFLFTSQN